MVQQTYLSVTALFSFIENFLENFFLENFFLENISAKLVQNQFLQNWCSRDLQAFCYQLCVMLALPFQNLDEIHVRLNEIIKVLDYVLDQNVIERSLVYPALEMSDNDLD